MSVIHGWLQWLHGAVGKLLAVTSEQNPSWQLVPWDIGSAGETEHSQTAAPYYLTGWFLYVPDPEPIMGL